MSKELTEQWRNGTLKFGYYYVKNCDGDVFTLGISGGFVDENLFQRIVEVLAPVPTYNQFVELTEKVDQFSQLVKKVDELEWRTEELEQQNAFECECNQEYISRLKEAEEALKYYANSFFGDEQPDGTYLIFVRENAKGRVEVTYNPNIAKQYLERYGVK